MATFGGQQSVHFRISSSGVPVAGGLVGLHIVPVWWKMCAMAMVDRCGGGIGDTIPDEKRVARSVGCIGIVCRIARVAEGHFASDVVGQRSMCGHEHVPLAHDPVAD